MEQILHFDMGMKCHSLDSQCYDQPVKLTSLCHRVGMFCNTKCDVKIAVI